VLHHSRDAIVELWRMPTTRHPELSEVAALVIRFDVSSESQSTGPALVTVRGGPRDGEELGAFRYDVARPAGVSRAIQHLYDHGRLP
jgi:hypothetical protein